MSSDITCANPACREPWDAYGVTHGDMTPEEAALFQAARGCPHCHFGYGAGVPLEEAITKAKQRPSFEWPQASGMSESEELESLNDFFRAMEEGSDTDEWLEEFDY